MDISASTPIPSGTGCGNVSFSAPFLTISGGGNIRIYGSTIANQVVVDSGAAPSITLDGVSIDVSAAPNAAAFAITGGSAVHLTLAGGTSTLKSGFGRAGLEVAIGNTVSISGTDTDALAATGGNRAAGNGGGGINISGGTVTATGGNWAAGIGGGGSGGTINISGGTVKSTDGGNAAGIGPSAQALWVQSAPSPSPAAASTPTAAASASFRGQPMASITFFSTRSKSRASAACKPSAV